MRVVNTSEQPHQTQSSSSDPTTIVLASDVRLYCEGLRVVLRDRPGMSIVHTATEAKAAVAAVREHDPDVLLIDMAMPESLWVVRAVQPAGRCRVVALALPETEATFLPCAEAGVTAYVPRAAELAQLVETIRCARRGEAHLEPRLAGSLMRRVSSLAKAARPSWAKARLTEREREVAELVSEGLSNKRIAAELHIGLATVKNHVHNVLKKLNVSRRAEVAARFSRSRLGERGWEGGARIGRDSESASTESPRLDGVTLAAPPPAPPT